MITQEKYWDKVAEEKEFTTPFQIELFKQNVSEKAKILDIGCGYGRTLNQLHLSGFTNLTGIDISKKMINRGSKLYPHLNIKRSYASGIPFEDNSFDAVILLGVLTCIINDTELEQLINEVLRILRDNGVVYINDFMINSDQRNIDRYDQYRASCKHYGAFELQEVKGEEGVVLRHYTKVQIDALTHEFKKIVFEPVVYTTMNGNKSNGFYYIGRNIKKIQVLM